MTTILLVGLYIACELIANITVVKPVQMGDIVIGGGVFIYALTFTLIDLINEHLGKDGARRVILVSFAANLLLAAYTQLVVHLPAPPYYGDQESFAKIFSSTPRIVAASLTAYLVASFIDTEFFAWWRERVGGYRWLRVLSSNAISTLVDSVVFITLAFWGVFPVLPLILGQYQVKMAVTVVSIPLIYLVRSRSGQGVGATRALP